MSNTETTSSTFDCWAILELMGHRRLAGYLREQEVSGHGFIRIDIHQGDDVVFVGRDYKRQDASCGHKVGTGVECSVEEGSLTEALPGRVLGAGSPREGA